MSDILALIGRIDNGDDWISWQKDATLLSLPQTEDIGLSSEQYDRITLPHGSASALNRSQYQAVIHRFNQASKHANKFAAWTDT